MKFIQSIALKICALIGAMGFAQQGPEDFPPLKFTDIPGAPKLEKPFLVMGETKPVMAEKHGLAGPAFWDWNNDGLKDLLVGEFETTSEEHHGDEGSTIRVYLNVGTKEAPKFTDEWTYARDRYGVALEVNQWCCIGFTPQFVDLDNDGIKDIITGQYHPGDVYWFRGSRYGYSKGIPLKQEGNPWSAMNEMHPGYKSAEHIDTFDYWVYSSANMGDFDGDGDLDLLTGGKYIRISENIGTKKSPNFGYRKPVLDVNGNALKVRVPNEKSKAMPYYRENKNKNASGAGKTQQHVVDWDNDGVLDILSTDEYIADDYHAVTFFKGVAPKNGEMQRFQPGVPLFNSTNGAKPFPGSGQRVYVDDWNNDGVKDLIVGASVVTVDGKFHSKMSWEWERDLGIPAGGKDYGRYPDQFDIPSFEDYIKGPMGSFVKSQPKDKQKEMYNQQMEYKKKQLKSFADNGIPDAPKMIHKGYIYVFLGKK